MKRPIAALLLSLTLVSSWLAQVEKNWVKMTVEDAVKVLNSSAWSQTQTDTDTSEMFWTPTKAGNPSVTEPFYLPGRVREQQTRNDNRADRGALNQAISVNYHVRFFSSKPIREALSRIVLLDHPEPGPKLIKEWQDFVDRDFGPYIVLTVTCASLDGRLLGPALQGLNSATPGSLKNNTYLERNDGKRVYLIDYRPPAPDGLGAKFVFPRFIDGERYLTSPKGSVRFVTDMGPSVKINVKFNLSDMIFSDRLEY